MDGSVTIGVSLDTTAVLSALSSLETRMASFGNGLSDALINPVMSVNLAAVVLTSVEEMAAAVTRSSSRVRDAMYTLAQNAASAFSAVPWTNTGVGAVSSVAGGMDYSAANVVNAARRIADNAASAMRSSAWHSIGYNMMDGVADGILSAGYEVVRAIERVARDAERAVKEYYRISSPSGLMRDEVGVMISRGIAEGIVSGSSYVSSAMEKVYPTGVKQKESVSGGGVTQNIYLRENEQSPYLTAKRIRKESEAVFRQS